MYCLTPPISTNVRLVQVGSDSGCGYSSANTMCVAAVFLRRRTQWMHGDVVEYTVYMSFGLVHWINAFSSA
jgi:hypothetical protein